MKARVRLCIKKTLLYLTVHDLRISSHFKESLLIQFQKRGRKLIFNFLRALQFFQFFIPCILILYTLEVNYFHRIVFIKDFFEYISRYFADLKEQNYTICFNLNNSPFLNKYFDNKQHEKKKILI